MKRKLRFFCLMIACFAIFQAQATVADNYAATLPGNATTTANTNSYIKLDGAKLKTKITSLPFTVEMAFKPTAYNTYGGLWSDRSSGTAYTIQYGSGVNYLRVDYNGTNILLPVSAVPVLNAWNHVALVVTSTSLKMVLNGVSYEKTGMTNTTIPFNGRSYIGQDSAGTTSLNRTVAGQFDEIRFWNTARTEAELSANKFKPLTGTETGLVAYYNFNSQNTADGTANAIAAYQPPTALTFLNLTTDATIISSANLAGINLSQGVLGADFAAATTTYTAYVPPTSTNSVNVNATSAGFLPIAAQTVSLTPASPTATIAVTSMDATTTTNYNLNIVKTDMNTYWSGNGVALTNTRAFANLWGWKCSNSDNTWGLTTNNRFNDVLATANTVWYPTTATAWGGRYLYLRWDGSGFNNINSVYTYPVALTAGKAYTFTYKYAWNSVATAPVLTYGIATDQLGSTIIASDTAKTSAKALLLKSKTLTFTAPSTGTYYVALKSSTASLCVVTDLTIAEDATTQTITSSEAALNFDASNLTKTFVIGGANLTSSITLVPPTGITLSKTTITMAEALTGIVVTATYDNLTVIPSAVITATSGTVTKTISVIGSNDGSCFTKLYPALTNLMTDPYVTSLSNYGGWGTKALVTDVSKIYCGLTCVSVGDGITKGTGSMDYNATGKILTNTKYRVHAMMKTIGGSFQIGIGGCGVNGSTADFNTLFDTGGAWQAVDAYFTSGTLAASQGIYFNNALTCTGLMGYIDNYEMYAVPKTYPSSTSLTYLGAGTKKVSVRAVNLSSNITITAPTGFSVTPTTLLSTVTGGTSDSIAITFAGGTSANGYVIFTSGTAIDSIQVTGTVAPSILTSKTNLYLDDLNLSDSIIVNGGNLTGSIAITAPTGMIVTPTSIPMASATNVKVKVTYDGTTSNVTGNIVLTSGTLVVNVGVAGSKNSDCFTPLYSGSLTNLIPSGQMNTLTGFGGWGHKDVVSGVAYCGAKCVKFTAVTNGYPDGSALDVNPVAWVASHKYRLRAMVKSVDGTFAFLANGTSPNFLLPVAMSGNNWVKIDTTFTVGTSPSSSFFTFNNVDGASTGKIAYIDNYELYDIGLVTNVDYNYANQLNVNVYKQGNQFAADFSLVQSSTVEFNVFNAQGMLISKTSAVFEAGNNHKVINANFPAGLYIVRITANGKSSTTKVIK